MGFSNNLIDRNGNSHSRKYATEVDGKIVLSPSKKEKYKQIKAEEKLALKAIKKEYKAFKNSLSKELSSIERYFLLKNKRAEGKAKFYEIYSNFGYDYELKCETEKTIQKFSSEYITLYNVLNESLEENEKKIKTLDKSLDKEEALENQARIKKYKEDAIIQKQEIVNNYKKRAISKKAYKAEKKAISRELKNKINYEITNTRLTKLNIRKKQLTKELKDLKSNYKKELNENNLATRDSMPTEVYKNSRLIKVLSLFMPGIGQVYNKQYKKAFLMFIGAIIVYGFLIPYFFGIFNYQGNGIFGLIDLAANGTKIDSSLIYMIEGFLGIIFLAFALVIILGCYNDSRKVRKNMIEGKIQSNWYESKKKLFNEGFPFLTLSPATIALALIVLLPVLTTIGLSLTNMEPGNQSKFEWIGFLNYTNLFSSTSVVGKAFGRILGWTLVWTFAATTLAVLIGFTLALLANNPRIKGKPIFRTIYLLPWATPAFITILFFSVMAAPDGFFTGIVENLTGWDGLNIKFNTLHTRIFLILMNGWLGSAYVFLLTTGVLQSIPSDLYEAASIDGASRRKKLFKITIPMVLLQTAPLLIGQYTFSFNNFSAIYLFNEGGPFDPEIYGHLGGSTDILISYIYKLTVDNNYQSVGAAVTMMISIVLIIFAAIGFRRTKAFSKEN